MMTGLGSVRVQCTIHFTVKVTTSQRSAMALRFRVDVDSKERKHIHFLGLSVHLLL